ncbi:oxidoreductase [Stereum hirsutum FP-91666 SS1]|uniref:oxidoreductase n=1 Tax=Stereum hirsutum (strain FP-91666) TaxID=721885 RepID=UPI000440DE02|nr:oxidoreductase [Stereum hirsutum FP-91666 SS1]EIM87559.1 oxidoreductase [Stereum hirsutum FP-91666 SS1]
MTAPTRRVTYVRLGNSGLKVSKIILGCMSYGSSKWMPWVLDEEEAVKHIKYAYDAGIQTFDTANVYSAGESEIILGKAIKQLDLPREEIVIMTKVGLTVARTPDQAEMVRVLFNPAQAEKEGYVNQRGLSRKHIFDSVKASLERLGVEYIDVLQFNAEYGLSLYEVVNADTVLDVTDYAIENNFTPFISMQNQYNLLYREEEREMMPTIKHFGVGSIPYSPLARGAVTRPYQPEGKSEGNDTGSKRGEMESASLYFKTYFGEGSGGKVIVDRVQELARKRGKTMAQIALAWVIAKDAVSAPIIGTTSLEKLEDNIGALEIELRVDEMKYLEEGYSALPVTGH